MVDEYYSAIEHQASGMVSEQMDCTIDDAIGRLKGYAQREISC